MGDADELNLSQASEANQEKSKLHQKLKPTNKVDDAEDQAEAEDMLSKAKKPNKVVVKIECRDLLDIELISKSDPFAVFYLKGEKELKWRRIG